MVSQLINDNGNPAANQFVINTPNAVYFQSYDSVVCKVKGGQVTLSDYWDYSNTTRKHLYIFLRSQGYRGLNSAKEVRLAIAKGIVKLSPKPSLAVR